MTLSATLLATSPRRICVLLLAVATALQPAAAQPAPADTTARPAAADTLSPGDANRVPYRSDRTAIEHILAAPSYALHYATRPLGWVVREAEERYPRLFEGRLPSYGGYPVFETGGASGFAGGAVLFYNDLPWGTPGHDAEVRALVGSRAYYRFDTRYWVPRVLPATNLALRAQHLADPREHLYTGGNDARAGRAFYAMRRTDLQAEAGTDWSARFRTVGRARFQHVEINPGAAVLDADDGERRLPAGTPGVGTANLATVEMTATLDLTSRTERSVQGTRLQLEGGLTEGLGGSNGAGRGVRFVRYEAQAVQFVPLPFLPPQRRLAVRGVLEKTDALGRDARVPFYHLPALGGADRLRGYRANRFRGAGALLFTAEYRWPIWSNLDTLLLAETGQVFSDYADLAPRRFHGSYGGGFHFVSGSRLAFRLELVGSPEGPRAVLSVRPAF